MTSRIPSIVPAAAALLLASLASAGGADTPGRPDQGVTVRVAPADDGKQGWSVSARDAKGMEHALQMESKDGKVIVRAAPDATRPWLGVLLSDPEEVARLGSGLPTKERRWTITAVAADSPAARAGLQRGDVIVNVAGREALIDGPGLLKDRKPGDTVMLDIERDGSPRKVRVDLVGHPGTVEFPDTDGLGAMDVAGGMLGSLQGLEALKSLKELRRLPCPPGTKAEDCPGILLGLPFVGGPRLGVSVEPMGEQLAKFFGAQPGRGLLVKDVLPATPAERGGIEAGDIILRVAGRDINVPGDIRSALEGKDEGDNVSVDLLRRGKPVTVTVTLDDVDQHGMMLPGFSPQDAERMAREAQVLSERIAEHDGERALTQEERAELERAMSEVRRAFSPEVKAELEAAAAEAREALDEARRERRAAELEREHALVEAQRQREASGAYDAKARIELQRALQAQPVQVVPRETLIEF